VTSIGIMQNTTTMIVDRGREPSHEPAGQASSPACGSRDDHDLDDDEWPR
jgi:hypothetical protein